MNQQLTKATFFETVNMFKLEAVENGVRRKPRTRIYMLPSIQSGLFRVSVNYRTKDMEGQKLQKVTRVMCIPWISSRSN